MYTPALTIIPQRLRTAHAERKDAITAHNTLETELATLRRELAASASRLTAAETEAVCARSDADSAVERTDILEQEHRVELATLRRRLASAEPDGRSVATEWVQRVALTERQLADARDEVTAVRQRMSAQVTAAETAASQALLEAHHSTSSLSGAQDEIISLRSVATTAEVTIAGLRREVVQWRGQAEEQARQHSSFKHACEELEGKLEQCTQESKQLHGQLSRAEGCVAGLRHEVDSLTIELETAETMHVCVGNGHGHVDMDVLTPSVSVTDHLDLHSDMDPHGFSRTRASSVRSTVQSEMGSIDLSMDRGVVGDVFGVVERERIRRTIRVLKAQVAAGSREQSRLLSELGENPRGALSCDVHGHV